MHVAVLGAGVIGVTSAYYLTGLGHSVTVIDRAGEPACGSSHANGGQLSYSFTDTLAQPGFVWQLPGLVLGRDPSVRIRPGLSAAVARWGLAFLKQCNRDRANANNLRSLKLAMRSARLLAELRNAVPLQFAFRSAGKLVILRSAEDVAEAAQSVRMKASHGLSAEVLSIAEAANIEPAIAHLQPDYAGAVYARNDEVADACAFTRGLSDWLQAKHPAEFRFGTEVHSIATEAGRVCGIDTDAGRVAADAVLVCLGAWSPKLLKPLGIDSNIYPMRGYSVTLPLGEAPPQVSVTALEQRIVFSRMNGQVRIAGFADFVGFKTTRDEQRVQQLLDVAKRVAPDAANYTATPVHGWGGFRPMTPSGLPHIGESAVRGLYLNTGHGMLGWTMACASGHDVAAAIDATEKANR